MNLKSNGLEGHWLKTKMKKVSMTMELQQIMCSVLLIVGVCMRVQLAAADPETSTVWSNCGNSGNSEYQNGSAFQRNLNQVLDSLVINVYPSGFNISSVVVGGQDSNSTVYGLVQCRADLDSSDCKQCASTAKANLVQGCHNTSGFIQLDGCFLRYDNHNFYNDIESTKNNRVSVLCNTGNSSQPQQFTNAVKVLLSNITAIAAQNPKLFGADLVAEPSSLTGNIYGLAQCWRDLSRTSCGSCLTYAFERIFRCQTGALGAQFGNQNCYLRYEVYEFFDNSVLSPSPAQSPLAVSSGAEGKNPKVLGISLGVVARASLGFVADMGLSKWNYVSRLNRRQQIYPTRGEERKSVLWPPTIANPEVIFKYDILKEATSNSNEENKHGEGGFGSDFKGFLPDGREVAVKRLYMDSRQGDAEFLNEPDHISRVPHKSLVKLLGCSVESSEKLRNTSLNRTLFDATKRHLLNWEGRYELMVGIARCLACLHEESQIRIIDRDNLLDDKYKPKIANFGLARFSAEDQNHVSTRIASFLGYMAPEYALWGQLTEKADVFSFGVLVLEVISGRKNQSSAEDIDFLIEETWRLYKAERALEIMDPSLKGNYSREEAIRMIKIGLLCTQAGAALRPSTSRVILMLTSEREHLPSPTRPAFIDVECGGVGLRNQVKRPRVIDQDKISKYYWP